MHLTPTAAHQAEMRHAHFNGAPGILVSGLVWITAAPVCHFVGTKQGVWALLIGGALIHPLSLVVTKLLGRPAKTDKANALNQLAMASTVWLILCCAMAYGLFLLNPALFFPAMMATIGSRYLVFASVFGRSVFWVLGVCLIAAAFVAIVLSLPPVFAAGLGGLIEILFAFRVFSGKGPEPASV
jgi:drug/metabolite transporter (DMT)-like permease